MCVCDISGKSNRGRESSLIFKNYKKTVRQINDTFLNCNVNVNYINIYHI